jgi:hypothetical protein
MLRVAPAAVPWTMLRIVFVALAYACALVGICGGGPKPVFVEAPSTFSWHNIVSSAMRTLRTLQQCGSRPLAAAVLVCVLLSIFDSTLGFPGEGPTGKLHEHDPDGTFLLHAGPVYGCLCALISLFLS